MEFTSTPMHKDYTDHNIAKEMWIEDIIQSCHDMLANDKLTIYDFGAKGDQILICYKDEDFDPEHDTKVYDMVRITICQNGSIEDTDDIHVDELEPELYEIWNKDFSK